jgi:hypothetical protein
MNADDPIDTIVLHEFRLHAADTSGAAARIVAGLSHGTGPGVPLLTSIEDERDVAIVHGLRASEELAMDRTALEGLVERWQPVGRYEPRIAERSVIPPSSYRLAVTGSGINGEEALPVAPRAGGDSMETTMTPLGLLWIGTPVGTHAGLLTLIGDNEDRPSPRADPLEWPLPLARPLGVRIYESR